MLNKVILMGRFTRDPEVRTLPTGRAVVNFSIAIDRRAGADGTRQTDFIECQAWGKLAEFCGKYFRKGSMAIVCGRLQTRSFAAKTGETRYVTEVVCDAVDFGETKKAAQAMAQSAIPSAPAFAPDFAEIDDDGEVPF